MPQKSPFTILLTDEERKTLESDARKYTAPYYKVIRAKVVLLAHEGFENKEIGERLELPRQIVSKWRKRFFEQRLEGLEDLPRPGRKPGFSPSDRGGDKGARV
jgi:transposase